MADTIQSDGAANGDSESNAVQLTVRGPIVISRHGRPALDRKAGPKLTWKQYQQWWADYEVGGLAADQSVPEKLMSEVADSTVFLTSTRRRAVETAQAAAPHANFEQSELFVEAPLPPPRLPGLRYLPKTWNILARAAWMNGHSLGQESLTEARKRAKKAASVLHERSAEGGVYLAAHGWFNRMLRPELRKLGWTCTKDGGDGYWSFRRYEYQGQDDDHITQTKSL